MKKIPNPFDWYPRDFWWWPDHDEKLLQVIDWVHDLDQVLPLIHQKRVCIQAGGATGVWPAYLSLFFEHVYTFEPEFKNFLCLNENVKHSHNVINFMLGLSSQTHQAVIKVDGSEANNYGAYHLEEIDDAIGQCVSAYRIDDLIHQKSKVDFICLDVEGFEERVLSGALDTIAYSNPVIMIEEKPLPHLAPGEHLKARKFLESIGYKEVLKVHRDVVFKRDKSRVEALDTLTSLSQAYDMGY